MQRGDPWLSSGLPKIGEPIYLSKWEDSDPAPTLLHIQSIADVELFVDGIRVNNEVESTGLFTGGITTSRWNDLSPEDIESIEILKGPAASALYGTAAASVKAFM